MADLKEVKSRIRVKRGPKTKMSGVTLPKGTPFYNETDNTLLISDGVTELSKHDTLIAELANKSKTSVPQVNIDEVLDNWKKYKSGLISDIVFSEYMSNLYKNSKYTNFMQDKTSGEVYFNPLNESTDKIIVETKVPIYALSASEIEAMSETSLYYEAFISKDVVKPGDTIEIEYVKVKKGGNDPLKVSPVRERVRLTITSHASNFSYNNTRLYYEEVTWQTNPDKGTISTFYADTCLFINCTMSDSYIAIYFPSIDNTRTTVTMLSKEDEYSETLKLRYTTSPLKQTYYITKIYKVIQ